MTVHEYTHYLKARPEAAVPGNWEDQRRFPHRPVVRVSFHDATAYCQWWSDATGKAIRLPEDDEWCKVAFEQYRKYPWGDEDPDHDRANYDWRIHRPTPVGLFPMGAVPLTRIVDMAGNAWEWTKSPFSKRTEEKFVRGGSFNFFARDLRAAFRYGVEPGGRGDDLGFRCLREVFP